MKNACKVFGFAVIAVIALNVLFITGCGGGSSDDPPSNEYPPVGARELKLYAEKWVVDGYAGENWTSEPLKFADYTKLGVKKGDVFSFKISGTSDKPIKYAGVQLFQKIDGVFKGLGMDSRRPDIGTSFTDRIFQVVVNNDVDTRYDVYVQFCSFLYSEDSNGNISYEKYEKIPADIAGDMTVVMATVSGFTMSVSSITLEDLTDDQRWSSYTVPDSTAILEHFSIDSDSTVKVTVGGIPELQDENDTWNAWKVNVQYAYTTKTNTNYTYKFMARTESGTRSKLNVQYYADNDTKTYFGKYIELTPAWQTFTIKGMPTPKAGPNLLEFQCANEIGTFYVKIISITESTEVSKSITITGMPAGTQTADLSVYDDNLVASAWNGGVSNGIFSFNLEDTNQEPWFGSGAYYLTMGFQDASNNWNVYVYTNGQQSEQKYDITSANSTIAFNKFKSWDEVYGGGTEP